MKNILIGASLALCSFSSLAEMKWNDFSLSYIKANNYEVGDNERQVLTVEHASGHDWGGTFFFLDHEDFSDGTVTNYFELSPNISLSYLTNSNLALGPIKDVYFATTWEGGDTFNNFLYGIGVNFNAPGFKYLNLAFYKANNELWVNDEQATLTWALPGEFLNQNIVWDGFIDWSSGSETQKSELNFTSQLKWNIAPTLGIDSILYVGIEYAYWINKYGIDGVDEKNPGLLVKWHF
ncbi:outer membrane protein OmpK [Colwellia sp. E2M01]|uniref:outer membrane protein OmpK n=1 Tax=Colwellia sp. E2M01 TaxID=2841561 RepID=UPI001C0A05CC|nr:outer membrane protein OmpK [Colwellia sp. E2M01]MBU2870653.1 ion channel protein Tsx [Colwellia sp. E2M01]